MKGKKTPFDGECTKKKKRGGTRFVLLGGGDVMAVGAGGRRMGEMEKKR